jgi:hypothetical protein
MKYRYIFEKWGEIYGTNQLTREHLIAVKDRQSDYLIDTLEGKYFDAENNEWKDINQA